MLVGRIVGKTSPENYQFEVTGIIRKMDFIATRDPERHWILGRVEEIVQENERTLATVTVLGYTDKSNVVKMPRMPFKPNSYVYKADDGLIKKVIGLKSSGMYVGLLDNSENLKVYLDPKLLVTKHMAVLAKSGFGKSYFTGVLLEEFIEKGIPAIVIDPHGEYLSLRNPNKKEEERKYMPRFEVEAKGYSKEVEIFCLEKNLTEGARKLKFRNKVPQQEILDMLPFKLTSSQLNVIYTAVSDTRKQEYTIDEVKNEVLKSKSQSKWNVISALDMLKAMGLFDGAAYVHPQDLVKKGKITIINLKGIEPDVQQIVVYKLSKDLFEARKNNKIQPFMFIVEEAHNFAPERGFGEAVSSRMLRTIASEGRKFGMGLGVISQRPARIDKNVLSQCSTQLFLRVTNPNDLKTISDSVEGITRGLEGQLKTLPIGTACVVGMIEQPLLVNIRIKRSEHHGVPAMLTEKFKDVEVEGDRIYFYPKILEDEVKRRVQQNLEWFKLVYYPMYRLKCKFNTKTGEKIDNIFVDGVTGELVYQKDNALARTDGLLKILHLNMKEKAILLYLTTYGDSAINSISKRLRIPERDVANIVTKLRTLGLITAENLMLKSKVDLNFEEILENQMEDATVSYKYTGDIVRSKIKEDVVERVLDLFNPDTFDKRLCFYPYWLLFYNNGNIDVIDAMTGEKDEYLKNKDVISHLPV